MAKQILLIEDDDHIGAMLQQALEREGNDVTWTIEGERGLLFALDNPVDLVLLDLKLPDIDGLQLCRRLRQTFPDVPIIILTARSEELDVVVGLDAGADDYVVKPFRLAELLARVRVNLRRGSGVDTQKGPYVLGNLTVDEGARRIVVDETGEVALRPKEFDLLCILVEQVGRAVSRAEIAQAVWGADVPSSAKTLEVHMGTLRRKLQLAQASVSIATIRGTGYRLDAVVPEPALTEGQ